MEKFILFPQFFLIAHSIICTELDSFEERLVVTTSVLFGIFIFAVVRIEMRSSHILGKCSTTELYSQPETTEGIVYTELVVFD
jgi:hypothetical protein